MKPVSVRVWDPLVRVLHLGLALGVLTAWTSGQGWLALPDGWHEALGHALGLIVLLRLLWGFVGTRHARFQSFLRSPRATLAYARALRARHEPRYLGHNPLGAWMIVLLLALVAALWLSGWLYTTDWLWGYAWLADTHAALATLLMVCVALHIAGVLHASWRHRESLIHSMITGKKRVPNAGDQA